jgi:hypothetical protein
LRRRAGSDPLGMGESSVLYAIAESCPFDSELVQNMKRSVDSLLQLNLRRFRVPQQNLAKYSALDIVKQALELLFEFSPSEKNYREAMRTIKVYSEEDEEMLTTLQNSFRLIANAVYNAYAGQRHVEFLAPQTLFLQGVPFDPGELQKSFRFVGVRPPEVTPPGVQNTIFLDESYEPYTAFLQGKIVEKKLDEGRERHWAEIILKNLDAHKKSLIRAGLNYIDPSTGLLARLGRPRHRQLPKLLRESGVELQVIDRIADVNRVFGK